MMVDKRRWHRCSKGTMGISVKRGAGDVDLNDGKLRQAYEQYKEKINWLKKIGL